MNRTTSPTGRANWHADWSAVAAAAACILAVTTYAILGSLVAWGHDEAHYYPSFDFKLVEDGRWLNYLLHDTLRSLPLETWALALVTGWAVLLHRMARNLGLAQPDSVLFASTGLLVVPFADLSLWPAQMMPAVLLLLALQWFAGRGMHPAFVYLVGGVLMFGTMQSFYFLLPLFFLAQLLDPQATPTMRWRRVMLHWTLWVGGAIVGVLAMSSLVWVLSGQFGVEPAEWRRAQPIEHVSDLFRNFGHVYRALIEQAMILAEDAGLANPWIGGGAVLLALARVRSLPAALPAIAMLVAVALGFFAMSVPLAPVIQTRSLVALWAAVVIGLALLPGNSRNARAAGAVLMVAVAWNLAQASGERLRHFDGETRAMAGKLEQLLPAPPSSFPAIALHGRLPDGAPLVQLFNDTSRMHGFFHAIGTDDYRDCRTGADSRCVDPTSLRPEITLPFADGELWFARQPDGVANVGWQPRPAPLPSP